MKRLFFSLMIAISLVTSVSSCKRCKKCHAEVFGVKSPAQELCGDQLEQAEKTAGMVCE